MTNKLYYKGELLTEIGYQNGKIWISDEIVKKNNCYIQFYDERFDGVIRWAENDSNLKADHYKKIICQSTELNIDGVPYVFFESNEVEKLAEKKYTKSYHFKKCKEAFIEGNKAHSETHSLSDDEVVEFAEFTDDSGYTQVSNGFWKSLSDEKGKSTKELLQLFKEQQSKEWEVVMRENSDTCNNVTEWVEPITYTKDGKEFLTIKLK